MITSTVSNSALTVREYADRLHVKQQQILTWIHSGELRAVNVCSTPGGKRPSWRISIDAICEFESRRSSNKPVKPARRKRKKRDPSYTEYF